MNNPQHPQQPGNNAWGTPWQGAPGGPQPGQPPQYAQPPGHPASGGGQVTVDIKHHPLAFMYSAFTPVITINGYRQQGRWGVNVLPLPPGNHHLRIHIPYLLPSEIGHADLTVPVQPGQQVALEYRAPMVVFMGGSFGVGPQKWPGAAFTYVLLGVAGALLVLMLLLVVAAAAA